MYKKMTIKCADRNKLFFGGILLFGILMRCAWFPDIPGGVNPDEAMAGVDAWALAQYGTDRFGVRYPVHFSAWQYSQMSVLLSYCMAPLIKLFGFNTFSVRLPMLVASCGSIVLVYLVGKKLFSEETALAVMALTAINPWHFMQSRWSLDCNLFPHVFLLAFYLLLLGFEKRRYLYLSMVFFGLTFYCYGVAVYAVIPFLTVFFLWCLFKRQYRFYEAVLCALIVILIGLPEVLVLAINKAPWRFHWRSIETPFFTMSYFPESIRKYDILFLNFSFEQLGRNLLAMLKCCFLQAPEWLFNSIPAFGTMYHISIPFTLVGIVTYTKALFTERDSARQTKMLALWGFLITGIWVGAVTFEVNINRINIIWFPLLFMCGYGIKYILDWFGRRKGNVRIAARAMAVCYGLLAVLFFGSYFTYYRENIKEYFNVDFLQAVSTADRMEQYDRLYITGSLGWQFNVKATEILTQYQCRIDAKYYQQETNVTGGRELLPYNERYHFIYPEYLSELEEGLYLFHISDLKELKCEYCVIETIGNYVLAAKE